jgi:hypothetical protein
MMTDLPNLIELGLLLLAVGALAGLLAGLLGVGGGIVLVPALSFTFTALGYASSGLMQICIATSLASIVFTSMRSMAAHHKKGAVDWGILKSWAPGIVVGAIVGVLTAASLSSDRAAGDFRWPGSHCRHLSALWPDRVETEGQHARRPGADCRFISHRLPVRADGDRRGIIWRAVHDTPWRCNSPSGGHGGRLRAADCVSLDDRFSVRAGRSPSALHHRRGQPSGVADHHLDDASHHPARRAAWRM